MTRNAETEKLKPRLRLRLKWLVMFGVSGNMFGFGYAHMLNMLAVFETVVRDVRVGRPRCGQPVRSYQTRTVSQ